MTLEEAAVIQRAIELVDMWGGTRASNASFTTLRLYQAVGRLKRARASKGTRVC